MVVNNIEKIKYLGRTLGCNLTACPQDVKESAYKGLVQPALEYGSSTSVWDLQSILLQDELEKVQKRAARLRFVSCTLAPAYIN